MKKSKTKLTKKLAADLIEFNKLRKRIGEPKYSPEKYLNYLFDKTKLVKKSGKLKASSIPVWAVTHENISSVVSDHIPTKPKQDYKKEISSIYTVAIPYNKGGYMLVPESEIHCIGKK